MKAIEKNLWEFFKEVVSSIFGSKKSTNYKSFAEEMLTNFQKLGCRVSVKVHYSLSHLNFFPANLDKMSE